MAKYTPQVHHVYNEFDKHGLLVGLPRLEEEQNITYKQRILDVYVNRADSTYRGLINAITRELGLSLIDCMKITPVTDSNGDTLLAKPAVVFEHTKCYLYSNYTERTLLNILDRFEMSEGVYDIYSLAAAIRNTGYWDVVLLPEADNAARSTTVFNQSSVRLVVAEPLIGNGSMTKLAHENITEGTVNVSSFNLIHRVNSQVALRENGDYCIDYINGIIYSVAPPQSGSHIRYEYFVNEFVVQSSPVVLYNLQSDDFKTKMFEQVTVEDGSLQNGRPTALGADIINELLSVYPSTWGK